MVLRARAALARCAIVWMFRLRDAHALALDLADGRCDECSFAAMDEPREIIQAAALNLIVYGGALGLALWGYRRARPAQPSLKP